MIMVRVAWKDIHTGMIIGGTWFLEIDRSALQKYLDELILEDKENFEQWGYFIQERSDIS